MYSYMITVLWCEMATHGGLALFQNENDLSLESDLTVVDKKKKITRYNQMIVAIVDVLTSFDVVTNDNR